MTDNDASSNADDDDLVRARALYWSVLVQLKVDGEYIQRYRDSVSCTISFIAIARAIVSVGAIGSWFAGIGEAKLWGGVIVVSQVAEAIFAVLPLTARSRALRTFVASLDATFIDALFEWEDEVQSLSADSKSVRRRWRKLMKTRQEVEKNSLRGLSLPKRMGLFRLAESAAAAYFKSGHGVSSP